MFLEKFNVLCFFETPVLRFALFSYYRRYSRTTIATIIITLLMMMPQSKIFEVYVISDVKG